MATYRYSAATLNISDRHDCPAGHVRLSGSCRQGHEPRDMDAAILILEDGSEIGPYPARVGAHWSDQPRGQAGYYLLFGPVPEADLAGDPDLIDGIGTMDACASLGA